MTHVKRRVSDIRPKNPGTGGKSVRYNDIRATDLPAIADALGIEVSEVIDTAYAVQRIRDLAEPLVEGARR